MSDRHTSPAPEPESPDGRGPTKDLLGPPESVQGKRLAKLVRERGPVPAAGSTLRTIAGSGAVVMLARQTSIGWEKLRRSDTALAATVTGISAVGIVVAAFVIGSPSPQADPPAPTLVVGTATSTAHSTTAVKSVTERGSIATSADPRNSAGPVTATGTEIPVSPLQPTATQGESSTHLSGGDPGAGQAAPTTTRTSPSGGTHSPPAATPSATSTHPSTSPTTPSTNPTSTTTSPTSSPTESPTPSPSPTPTDTATPPATTTDPPPPAAATTAPPAPATTAG